MKIRHVFATPDMPTVEAAMEAARAAGIDDADILLIARSDIEAESIPDERREADTDFMPAALRGAGYGGVAGLLAGLIVALTTPLEANVLGVLAATAAGALLGAWASSLFGSALPDPIRVKFDDEIKQGNILLVVDGDKALLDTAEPAITRTGARLLPFECSKAFA